MSGFLTITLIALVFIIIYQIAKASEYAAILRGKEKVERQTNRTIAWLMVAVFVFGIWGIWECHEYMMPKMLPISASDHGVKYDDMLKVTLILTGIVFFITQTLLFWFTYRYQASEKRTSYYFPHNNKLELLWTTVPAITMAVLVAIGLRAWSSMTAPAPENSQVVEIVGKQFNWIIRYPGKDKVLGKRDFRNINDANNVLGLDWNDKANHDDVIAENGEMHLIVNKPVKLIIGSRDVIHDVGLAHFRMKMDAVPGIVTTMWFTPTITTAEMKKITGNPNFVYEISCDQMCGKGHYSMRGTVIVETEVQHKAWLMMQKSYYATVNAPSDAATPATDSTAKATTSKAITMN
ncbi:MAG: cytochrome c oxidase subunit II [Bacteroidetes bacterium]|nr:cytochrome c oxidase subunit II [Bacteroidota bacterium]MBS1740883.1 cytochrome c oxidase subunit II [Bacteroidota bacterium]MBS1775813.1 cytochrome c oxidase subunit II [Bacteroidota bacterium]